MAKNAQQASREAELIKKSQANQEDSNQPALTPAEQKELTNLQKLD
jgi:hypothetical protein